MHFDALTLACVATELKQTLSGGRVQQVVLPDAHSVGMEIYAQSERRYLLISAQPGKGRVHLMSAKLRRGVEKETPLLLLLRKYVRGAVLVGIEQPDPGERILHLRWEHPQHGATLLVVEPMGRLSNLLFLKPGPRGLPTILECLHRVPPSDRAQRVLLPGRTYSPPPLQEKIFPSLWDSEEDRAEYQAALATATASATVSATVPATTGAITGDDKLWKSVLATFAGVSPTQAREIAWRATGNAQGMAQEASPAELEEALRELWSPLETGAWQPGLIFEDERIIGFSPYPLHYRGEFLPTESMSLALERYFAEGESPGSDSAPTSIPDQEGSDGYAALRQQAGDRLQRAIERLQRQLDGLTQDEPAPGEAERVRMEAEWLLALNTQIAPRQEVLEVDLSGGMENDEMENEGDNLLRIALDPDRTPVEQAERMFDQAAKMERAAKAIPIRRAQVKRDLDFVEQLENDLTLAENRPEIEAILADLETVVPSATKQKRRPKPGGKKASGKSGGKGGGFLTYYSTEGYRILVGRNARQNEAITFNEAGVQDLWLHVRNAPGSHVVIRSGGQPVSEETIIAAAQLAAYYSQMRGERSAVVSITERRNINRIPGGRTGQVTLRNEETRTVRAELPDNLHAQ